MAPYPTGVLMKPLPQEILKVEEMVSESCLEPKIRFSSLFVQCTKCGEFFELEGRYSDGKLISVEPHMRVRESDRGLRHYCGGFLNLFRIY